MTPAPAPAPAPALDRLYVVDAIHPGALHRADHTATYLAGKGINVARTLRKAGNVTVAVAPMSMEDANVLKDRQFYRLVPVTAPLRVNTVLVARDGVTTNINQAATPLSEELWRELCRTVAEEAWRLRALILGGSLPVMPSGSRPDPGPLFEAARASGFRVGLDLACETSGCHRSIAEAPKCQKTEPKAHVGRDQVR